MDLSFIADCTDVEERIIDANDVEFSHEGKKRIRDPRSTVASEATYNNGEHSSAHWNFPHISPFKKKRPYAVANATYNYGEHTSANLLSPSLRCIIPL